MTEQKNAATAERTGAAIDGGAPKPSLEAAFEAAASTAAAAKPATMAATERADRPAVAAKIEAGISPAVAPAAATVSASAPMVANVPTPAASSDTEPCGVLRCGEPRAVDVDIVIPVYNEQEQLGSSVVLLMEQLRELAEEGSSFTWQVVIADNASTDRTWDLARALSEKFPFTVRAMRIPQKGRGRALKCAWGSSKAQVMAYMDVDLSTDTRQIPALVEPILQGRADVSFGSRLLPGSQVERCLKREFISRTYNRMLQSYLDARFRDAQCGFKAISAEAARSLLPIIEDNEWFFDTELLVLAESMGIATNEFAVRWREDPGSTVHIVDTVRKDLAGMKRMHDAKAAGKLGARPQLACPTAPGKAVSATAPAAASALRPARKASTPVSPIHPHQTPLEAR